MKRFVFLICLALSLTKEAVSYFNEIEECHGPGVAGIYGDPHIVSFDGLEYNFNGLGKFVLVKTLSSNEINLEVQGVLEEIEENVQQTQMTTVIAKVNSDVVLVVSVNGTMKNLEVSANNEIVDFQENLLGVHKLPGATIYAPTQNQTIYVVFDNAATLNVTSNSKCLSAKVTLPCTFANKTLGLFGNWTGSDTIDDFLLPDGTLPLKKLDLSNSEQIYEDFGKHWMLDEY